MKKTLNINIAGTVFVIDENAYDALHNYLEALKAKFNNAAERDEILNDIEARIAEMLAQKLVERKQVVSEDDVQQVINVMGKPEDIAGEESEPATAGSGKQENAHTVFSEPIKKRLFRDPDDAKVGGVISGLCHYFGVDDPVWARLAVIVLCFVSLGTVLLIYFLLLIAIPKAQTAAEKLQMKGEPININTIEKEIKDAVAKASDSANKFVGDQTFLQKLLTLFVTVAKGILKIIAAIIIFFGLFFLFAVIAALFGVSVAGNALITHTPHLFIESVSTFMLVKIGLVLCIAAPVIGLIYLAIRLLLGSRTKAPWLKWVLGAAWWVGIIFLFAGVYLTSREFSSKATKGEEIALMQPANGTLFVQLTDSFGNKISDDDDDKNFNFSVNNGITINGVNIDDMERLPIGEPHLQLMPSANDSFYVQKLIFTRGKNKGDALTNSGYVIYNFSQRDTVLNLPAILELDKNGKYRFQQMKFRIAIPEGKFVRFADNIDRWRATVKGNAHFDDTYFNNTVWTTQNGRVICVQGENHFNAHDEKSGDEEKEIIIKKKDKKIKVEVNRSGKDAKEDEEEK